MEILLEAMQKVLGLLDGMYTIAVTDGKSLVVARDPIGKKPLYYVQNMGHVFCFGKKGAVEW